MGLLDQLTGALGQQIGGNQAQGGVMQMVLELVNNHPGGLQGLVQKFADAGLAQHVQSWVGTGANLPVSAEQIQNVLGSGQLAALAKQFGLSESTAAGGLSQMLPQVVDHLTPNGAVQDDLVQQGLGLLKGKLLG